MQIGLPAPFFRNRCQVLKFAVCNLHFEFIKNLTLTLSLQEREFDPFPSYLPAAGRGEG
jgi:hypothetical protein